MKHLFVPYELALKLKEKGFNEPCIAFIPDDDHTDQEFLQSQYFVHNSDNKGVTVVNLCAPLYQQVIDWLDSKNIHISIHPEFYKDGINWNWQVLEYDPNGEEDPLTHRYSYTTHRSTGMYGDNGEYPKRMDAVRAAIEEALKLV